MRRHPPLTGPHCTQLACDYADHLYSVSSLPDDVGPILMVLREALRYEDLEIVADAALAHEPVSPTVRRLYAQALVDGGNPAVALQLYTDLATDETALVVDQMEARGGIGRCYKEMFLSCTEPARRQRYLTRSLDAYLTAYQENSARTWHGINAVALLARAGRTALRFQRKCRRPPRWPTRSCGPSTRHRYKTRGPR